MLCNAFATKVIDYSQADIYELRNTEMTAQEFERLLISQNEFTFEKFTARWLQMQALNKMESNI